MKNIDDREQEGPVGGGGLVQGPPERFPLAADVGALIGRSIANHDPNGPVAYVLVAKHVDGSYVKYDFEALLNQPVRLHSVHATSGDPRWTTLWRADDEGGA